MANETCVDARLGPSRIAKHAQAFALSPELALTIVVGDASMERCTLRQARKKGSRDRSFHAVGKPAAAAWQRCTSSRQHGRIQPCSSQSLALPIISLHRHTRRQERCCGRRIATQAKVSEREKSRASAAVGCTSWADALGVFKICLKHSCSNCSPRQRRSNFQLPPRAEVEHGLAAHGPPTLEPR